MQARAAYDLAQYVWWRPRAGGSEFPNVPDSFLFVHFPSSLNSGTLDEFNNHRAFPMTHIVGTAEIVFLRDALGDFCGRVPGAPALRVHVA